MELYRKQTFLIFLIAGTLFTSANATTNDNCDSVERNTISKGNEKSSRILKYVKRIMISLVIVAAIGVVVIMLLNPKLKILRLAEGFKIIEIENVGNPCILKKFDKIGVVTLGLMRNNIFNERVPLVARGSIGIERENCSRVIVIILIDNFRDRPVEVAPLRSVVGYIEKRAIGVEEAKILIKEHAVTIGMYLLGIIGLSFV